jgi:hypothetical protein
VGVAEGSGGAVVDGLGVTVAVAVLVAVLVAVAVFVAVAVIVAVAVDVAVAVLVVVEVGVGVSVTTLFTNVAVHGGPIGGGASLQLPNVAPGRVSVAVLVMVLPANAGATNTVIVNTLAAG